MDGATFVRSESRRRGGRDGTRVDSAGDVDGRTARIVRDRSKSDDLFPVIADEEEAGLKESVREYEYRRGECRLRNV
jgi:hypothetical protein